MPPPRQYWPVEFRERLLVVGYLGRPTGLASQGGWRDSYSCFGSIPSVIENSILYVEEQSFPQTTPN